MTMVTTETLRRKRAHLLATEESLAVVGTLINEVSDLYKDSDNPPDLTQAHEGYRALEDHFAHLFRFYRRSLLEEHTADALRSANGKKKKKKKSTKKKKQSVSP